jgi:2-iminobutanoate/2-iminopropanoate deaminase
VCSGEWIFASGQIPLDPVTGKPVGGEIEDQTRRVLENLSAVLVSGGSSLERVVRTTVYVTDLSLFPRINAVYAEYFTARPAPARATVQVAALPLGVGIEIDAIARAGR